MNTDVLIIGAGIIGCALAEACSRRGMHVAVLEAGVVGGGVTAAGMGHLVVLDGSLAELALCHDGLRRWQAMRPEMPSKLEYRNCGTLWLAQDADELAEAERKAVLYSAHGINSELLTANRLYRYEPHLAPGLAGGLRVPGDAVMYPPAAAAWLLDLAWERGAQHWAGQASQLAEGEVLLSDGRRLRARHIVVAAGNQSTTLLPQLPLLPRKGQLLITERYPAMVQHQLVELGYIRSAHASDGDSVAFNVQPRATGQLLIGSSRQFDDASPDINWPLLRRMLHRAFEFMPALRDVQGIRSWAGFRPATPDKLPLLGPMPGREGIWLATGHEGFGVATALSSAELLAQMMAGEHTTLDPEPYSPARFAQLTTSTPRKLERVS